MDINIARCIKRQSNTDTTELHIGVRDDPSESIKPGLTCRPGYTNIPEPEHSYCTLQADLFRSPHPLAGFDSGNNKFPDVHLDHHLQTTLLPFAGSLKPNINNLLRKR